MVHRDTETQSYFLTMTMTFLVGLRPRRPKGRGNEGARGRENLLQQIVISHLRPHALPLSLIYAGLPTPGSNAARISSVSMLVDILPMKTCNSTTMAAIVFKLSVK